MGTCKCGNCGKIFEKPQSEITRNLRLNRDNFCCRSCVGQHNVKNFKNSKFYTDKNKKIKRYNDEYTKFKHHFRNIKCRDKEVNITIEDLKEQWDKQNGICPFSGIKLILVQNVKKEKHNIIFVASLDRIDSNKGYVKNNIRWVSRPINLMKNNMSDLDTIELCINIARQFRDSI